MRILQLVHGLPIGGTEVMVAHLVRGLKRSGLDVGVGCLDTVGDLGEALRREGFRVELLSRKAGFDSGLPEKIAALVKDGGYDLVHAHQYTCFFYAALSRPKSGKPLVFTEHGRFYPDVPSLKRRFFNFLFARRADRITAVSEGVRQSLARVEGFDPARIDVIYNGIEVEHFRHAAARAGSQTALEAKAALGLTPDIKVIGTVGRLDSIKNQAFLIHAIRDIRKIGLNAHLLIVGEGPELSALQALSSRLSLSGVVHFLGKRGDVDRILPAMDVFALSSFSEGTPMTIIEAMASSTPIVSTGVGGIPEIVTHGVEGLLVDGVPPETSQLETPTGSDYLRRFVEELKLVLVDPLLAARLRQNALERVLRDFSLEAILMKYLTIYQQLRGSPRKAPAFPVR